MATVIPLLLLLLFPTANALFGLGRMQSVAVRGRLMCNGFPSPGVRVKLYDTEIFFDHQMAVSYSNPMGLFMLSGHKREFTNIDPRLYIYHRCNYNGPCLKKSEIEIPRNFISYSQVPLLTAEMGSIDLNGRFSSDSVDCVN